MGGVGAIPISKMYAHLRDTGTPASEWEAFTYLWREMDAVTLRHYAKKLRASSKKAKDSVRGGSRGKRSAVPSEYPE